MTVGARRLIRPIVAALSAGTLLVLSACSSSGGSTQQSTGAAAPPASQTAPATVASTPAGTPTSSTPTSLGDMAPAAALAAAYKGTFGTPPTTGPNAVSGKTVWVVSCGQAAYSCSIPAGYAIDAVKAIGWTGHLCDGQLNPAVESTCVQQAVAARANAVLLAGIDCSGLVAALKSAKAAGLKIISPLGFDCDDPHVNGQPVFSANITYQGDTSLKQYMIDWGTSKAAWIIGDSKGSAKVIDVTLDGVLVPTYADQGFQAYMAKCSGCKIVDTVRLTLADLGSNAAAQKVATALQSHSEATYLHAPFDSAIPAFIAGAIKDSGRKDLKVMGSECFATNLDYIRTGGPENACSALAEDWGEWAAVDDLNRIFAGDSPSSLPNSGIGLQLVDKTHNLPTSGAYVAPIDFRSGYAKVWGR